MFSTRFLRQGLIGGPHKPLGRLEPVRAVLDLGHGRGMSLGRGGSSSGRITQVRRGELPRVPNPLPVLTFAVLAALGSWGAFTLYATNKEKLGSSIFKSIVTQLKTSPSIHNLLSNPPMLKKELYLGGVPRVKGAVNMMQGRVDLSFKITTASEDQTATVYFTSIRAHKHAPFDIIRFLVVHDQTGHSVSLLDHGLSSIDSDSGDII